MSTPDKSTKPEPYYCDCGCQWHGRYVRLGGESIASHKRIGHQAISHDEFKRFYRCGCSDCTGALPSKFVSKADLIDLLRRALKAIDAQCAVSETYYDDTAEVRRDIIETVGED